MKLDLHFISGSPNFSLIQAIQQKWLCMTSRETKVDLKLRLKMISEWLHEKNSELTSSSIEIGTFLENCKGFDNPLIAQES